MHMHCRRPMVIIKYAGGFGRSQMVPCRPNGLCPSFSRRGVGNTATWRSWACVSRLSVIKAMPSTNTKLACVSDETRTYCLCLRVFCEYDRSDIPLAIQRVHFKRFFVLLLLDAAI
ncbi:hypothetical protein BDW22DRAFT_593281 [Trametopsis cervina]|nr:hypothetical protein BDW22DRAFT_593281 [Trametopsis cervina]